MALLEIKNLSFKYNNSDKLVLNNINLKIDEGDFVLLCGESGCGKTTLLRLIKRKLAPCGDLQGEILYQNQNIDSLDERKSVTDFGYVMQNPDNQIVTDKVWHELAFALENIGEESDVIRRKIAEISGFFGISKWYNKNTNELSGGEKQLLNLASVMVLQPKLLLLDEAISQLDPISSREFLFNLKKINEELGITIIIVDHKLDEIFSLVNKVVVMDRANIHMIDTPRNTALRLEKEHKMSKSLPTSVKIFREFEKDGFCPLNVKEARNYLHNNFYNDSKEEAVILNQQLNKVVIEICNAYFRYNRDSNDILKNLSLKIYENEFISIVGGNGVGKTTLLKVLSGLKKIYSGKIKIFGKNINKYNEVTLHRNNIATLPQNPTYLFTENSVYDEMLVVSKLMISNNLSEIEKVSDELNIRHLWESHPYDLSGGEQQKLALAKLLLINPKILLLDEPTKGLDTSNKDELANILLKLKEEGKTIVIVTHDIEFAAKYSDRCAMYFDGQIVSIENSVKFFSENNYYTTSASRITRDFFKNAVTTEMAINLCQKNGKK